MKAPPTLLQRLGLHRPAWLLCLAAAALNLVGMRATAAEGAAQALPADGVTLRAGLPAAIEAARADGSLILLDFGATWCPPCVAFKRDTLPDPAFRTNAGVVQIVMVDTEENPKMAESYDVSVLPTLVWLTAEGKIVDRRTGFVDAPGLAAWLKEVRARAARGEWEGTAPGLLVEPLARKAAVEGLEPADLVQLVRILGDRDPGNRMSAGRLLLAQREAAMPALLDALGDSYLGIRIGSSEVLARLAPGAPGFDPWQPVAAGASSLDGLRRWWRDTGRLTPEPEKPPDASMAGAITAAIDAIRKGDAIQRTEAMASLVRRGSIALPAIREALHRHERTDPAVLPLIDEVRWAILVPDAVERRLPGIRNKLARGSTQDRQVAALKLAKAGGEALPPLVELTSDPDPVVVEAAVRALSTVEGGDTLVALAAMLKASDGNIRMTAAQALGRTGNRDAVPHLLSVIDDPNEIVATAALAALEQVLGGGNSGYDDRSNTRQPDLEVIKALRHAVQDPRWRVRAAAVGVTGKLRASALVEDVARCLKDPDSFVVKEALTALQQFSSGTKVEDLADVARRHPGLIPDVATQLVAREDSEAVAPLLELWDKANTEGRRALLGAFSPSERGHYSMQREPSVEAAADPWERLFERAGTSPDVSIRLALIEALKHRSPRPASRFIPGLLSDESGDVREAGALLAVQLDARKREGSEDAVASRGGKGAGTNVVVTAEMRHAWRESLLKHVQEPPRPGEAAALVALEGSSADVRRLAESWQRMDAAGASRLAASPAMEVIATQSVWPDCRPVLDAIVRWPSLYAAAVCVSDRLPPPAADYLLHPDQFLTATRTGSREDIEVLVQAFVAGSPPSHPEGRRWSMLEPSDRTDRLVLPMLEATNAVWRALGAYVAGHHPVSNALPRVAAALQDPSPGVRRAAVQGSARVAPDRAELGARVGALLADGAPEVAVTAALALLEPEVASASGLSHVAVVFRWEGIEAGPRTTWSGDSNDRPLTPVDRQPAWLDAARKAFTSLSGASKPEAQVFALLLAQHGDFAAVNALADGYVQGRGEMSEPLLTGIALTHDARNTAALKKYAEAQKDTWSLRTVLRSLRGMTGSDARRLRIELNQRLRKETP